MTDAKPDMAKLRVISDSELRLREVIGSGAFGTVYSVCQSIHNVACCSVINVSFATH